MIKKLDVEPNLIYIEIGGWALSICLKGERLEVGAAHAGDVVVAKHTGQHMGDENETPCFDYCLSHRGAEFSKGARDAFEVAREVAVAQASLSRLEAFCIAERQKSTGG